MKKFLSLVLALAMALSLVTISAGATSFDDDGDITYRKLSRSSPGWASSRVMTTVPSTPLEA